jgi:hypothetical protein
MPDWLRKIKRGRAAVRSPPVPAPVTIAARRGGQRCWNQWLETGFIAGAAPSDFR